MRVLLTGSSGYIGNVVRRTLEDAGHEVRGFDLLGKDAEQGDVRDARALYWAVYGMDAVVHLAAVASVDAKPKDLYETNVNGTINVLNAMVARDLTKIVFASSAAVYPTNRDSREGWFWEGDSDPFSSYGTSKYLGESILADYRRAHDIDWLAFRFFNVAGAGENRAVETHLIPNLIKAAKTGEPCQIYGGYDTCRDYVHVDDVARAHLQGLEFLMTGSHAAPLNICTGVETTNKQLIDELERVSGKAVPTTHIKPRSQNNPRYLVGNPGSAWILLDWEPQHDLNSILRSSWEWFSR